MTGLSHHDLRSLRFLVRSKTRNRQKSLDRFALHEGQSAAEAEISRQKIISSIAFYSDLHDRVREAEQCAKEASANV